MPSEPVDTPRYRRARLAGGAMLLLAGVLAVVRPSETTTGGSIAGVDGWMFVGVAFLLAGVLMVWDATR